MKPSLRQIQIRDAEPSDHAFLFATYLKNNWYDQTQSTTLKKHTWMALQHRRLEKVLNTKPVKIACLSEDPEVILGYAFKDGDKPFSYVKLAWRSTVLRIAETLIESLGEKQ